MGKKETPRFLRVVVQCGWLIVLVRFVVLSYNRLRGHNGYFFTKNSAAFD